LEAKPEAEADSDGSLSGSEDDDSDADDDVDERETLKNRHPKFFFENGDRQVTTVDQTNCVSFDQLLRIFTRFLFICLFFVCFFRRSDENTDHLLTNI
jgi:hypothetical protein